ncbi:hypothetical protein GALMADRAFT_147761 [Galerina marginata CBS 339.88]|uniref:Glycoside hydrolase family 12 protein n=1 Tax=Galerina marginata (strain CBS 339.88) TaxID=685588 RepID=A0A067S9A6_GALM3|nr:hypothetical protein GALMADRAFT_147761 [Galerina marginata CBS 339.88]
MFSPRLLFFASLVPFVIAAPVNEVANIDTSSHCGTWDSVTAGPYSLNLDQWGISGASGSDCASLTSLNGNTIAWKTTWKWTGGNANGVKTYTDIQLNNGLNKQLSAIKSIPVVWNWSQSSTGTVKADVAYDLFTASSAGGNNVNEIMVWLANINVGPISSSYGANGANPVATNIALAGHTWNLYKGPNGSTTVFSFLPSNGAWITSFSGDLNEFLKYLTAHQGVSTSQYLKTAQGGTEATSGTATLTS